MAGPLRVADVTLSAEEWSIVSGLRAVPESPLKQRLLRLFETLLRFVGEPRCTQTQADGVPCTRADARCDECLHVETLVDALTRDVLAGFDRRPPR